MLKEEMEKQLGVEVSMPFYITANAIYLDSNYRNNLEFCEELKKNKLLMLALREHCRTMEQLKNIKVILNNTTKFF